MAFCANCGTQVADNLAFCPACGKSTQGTSSTPISTPGPGAGAAYAPAPVSPIAQGVPVTADEAKGFVTALFDLSFSSFVTTKLIKVLFLLCIAISALGALGVAASGFSMGAATGLLMLIIVAPIVFLLSVIYARVVLEIIIVIFRMAENLAEIAERGRRTAV